MKKQKLLPFSVISPPTVRYRDLEEVGVTPEGVPIYRADDFVNCAVSKDGRVWRLDDGQWKEAHYSYRTKEPHHGATVSLRHVKGQRMTLTVGAAILHSFVGPRPPGMHCCHGNGDNRDNRLENLRWDSPAGNYSDLMIHGSRNQGETHGSSTLTEAEVRQIRNLRESSGLSEAKIGSMFGVSQTTISSIIRRRTWKHVI